MTKPGQNKNSKSTPSKEQLRLYKLAGIIFLIASIIFLLSGLIFQNNVYATGVPFLVLGITFLALGQQQDKDSDTEHKNK